MLLVIRRTFRKDVPCGLFSTTRNRICEGEKKFEGGPPFDESHANEFDNGFNEKFDCTRVDYKGVHLLIGSCGGETNKLPW